MDPKHLGLTDGSLVLRGPDKSAPPWDPLLGEAVHLISGTFFLRRVLTSTPHLPFYFSELPAIGLGLLAPKPGMSQVLTLGPFAVPTQGCQFRDPFAGATPFLHLP